MELSDLKKKLKVVKNDIPFSLYQDLLKSDDIVKFESILFRFLQQNKEISLQVDWLYSLCHEKTVFYGKSFEEERFKPNKGNKPSIS